MYKSSTPKIVVGMSGGVDSSVSALLLFQQGFDVSGLFMHNWEYNDEDGECPSLRDSMDAMHVCERIGIRFDAISFASEYWQGVFSYFLDEYRSGRTPNPDVLCNREIKFKAFLDYALNQGADLIATGHYARVDERDGVYHLYKAHDLGKDQSYFLYALDQYQLSRSLFPLGDIEKIRVRRLAREAGFDNHAKKDSTGICFIGERKFREFLSRYLPAQPGEMRTPDNKLIGTHEGLMYYTLGQRKGLGIGGRNDNDGEPWYVVDKRLDDNVLIVAQGEHHPLLYHNQLEASTIHWISGKPKMLPFRCMAKTRYRQADQSCAITELDDHACQVIFDQPQRAMTPGQSVVFYDGDRCLGGGIIERTGNVMGKTAIMRTPCHA